MDRRSVLRLAVAPLAATAATAIPASPLSVGFETLDRRHFDPEKAYAPLGRLGVKWARVQTGWSRCETRKGEYDFRWLDAIVDGIRAQGVQPWFNLTYGNKLYAKDSPLESAVGWAPVFDAESRQAWVRFTERLAAHFRTRVKHWEIWNEPDIKVFWKPSDPSPEGYAALVKMTAPAIRQAIPEAVIVGGALASFPNFLDFAERAFDAGLAAHIDRVSYHAYFPRPEAGYRNCVNALRALAKRYKPSLELWQGESGAPAAKGGVGAMANLDWTEERQAKWLLRRILTDLDAGVELASYFHLVDLVGYREGASEGQDRIAMFGLLRRDYAPRPSYHAYQTIAALFDAQTRKADFIARIDAAEEVYAASFERNGMPLYVYWAPRDLFRDQPTSQASATFWSGLRHQMKAPVLVDPLTAAITSIGDFTESRGYGRVPSLPLRDYPLILTDRQNVMRAPNRNMRPA